MNEIEKLKNAAALIEEMTDGRQTVQMGGMDVYIRAAEDANFALQMRLRPNFEQGRYEVTFEAFSRQMGVAMDSRALAGLLEEAGQLHALMTALEMQSFQPKAEEYRAFLIEFEQAQEIAPTMGQTF